MPKKRKPNDLFGTLNSINNKTPIEYSKKEASAYIVSLWLAQDRGLIGLVNNVNEVLFGLPDELVYKFYYNAVPKRKRFIRWTKKSNEYKELEAKAKQLQDEYGISKREAFRSLGIM